MSNDPHETLRAHVIHTAVSGPGESEPALRAAAFAGRDLPADLATLVEKVHRHAYQVTDADVAMPQRQRGDDVMFEVIVSAALGAASQRLATGLRALEEA